MKQTVSLFICLVFIAQSTFAAKDYDQSNKGQTDNLETLSHRQQILKAEKARLAKRLQQALGSTIILDPSLGNSKEAQERALNESIAEALYGNGMAPKDVPKKSFKRSATTWSGRFASGNGGFMLGSQILCALNAGASRDPMVWDACVDHFLSIEAWRDLAVFSIGSHMYSDNVRILRGVISNPQARRVIYANAITKMMSEIFMTSTANGLVNQGVGMTMGSMLQHFFIKYINSKETENRKINYKEWGYWFGEYTFTMRKIEKVKAKLNNSKSLKGDERSDLSGILQQLELYATTAKERVEKHRNHWFVYLEQSLKNSTHLTTPKKNSNSGLIQG
ncbi:MAG: hypothetical protein IPM57_00905 [Oligoflexia bacterium]|nr:hypothetical protein [Oligoflexia bacterium]